MRRFKPGGSLTSMATPTVATWFPKFTAIVNGYQ